ncbi:MAG: SRPBCC family protein [Ardenticatenales bacterium]|nr:SRPBCC family protein [Ardenticatenales bacterium]
MSTYQVEESAVIDAPVKRVYGIISDYHEEHPAILPSRYFTKIQVTQGGQGAGTAVMIEMNVLGAKMLYQMTVSEPEPGRVLREEDAAAGVVTTFTVDPINGGVQSRVTIVTSAKTSSGLKGWMEKLMTPAITRRIYREELAQLAIVAQRK